MASKRKTLSVTEKVKVYDDYKNSGKSVQDFATSHGVAKSVLQRIIKAICSLKSSLDHMTVSPCRKRQRESGFTDIDEALLRWFKAARGQNLPLSGPMIRTKAEKLAKDLGHDDWKCSDGWFTRWKKRNQSSYKVG